MPVIWLAGISGISGPENQLRGLEMADVAVQGGAALIIALSLFAQHSEAHFALRCLLGSDCLAGSQGLQGSIKQQGDPVLPGAQV